MPAFRVLRLFAGDRKSPALELRAVAAHPQTRSFHTGRGGTIPDYYSRKQLKHARNAALVVLVIGPAWAVVIVLALWHAAGMRIFG